MTPDEAEAIGEAIAFRNSGPGSDQRHLAGDIAAALLEAAGEWNADMDAAPRDRPMEDGVEEALAGYRKRINETPALLSLLYDADLLPEQIVSMRGAISMAAVVEAYEAGARSIARDLPAPPDVPDATA
jgi:hypothetical protein